MYFFSSQSEQPVHAPFDLNGLTILFVPIALETAQDPVTDITFKYIYLDV